MKLKKEPKADLNRKSLLFFQTGLILILFIAWQGIEYKTGHAATVIHDRNYAEPEEMKIPVTVVHKEKPAPLPVHHKFNDLPPEELIVEKPIKKIAPPVLKDPVIPRDIVYVEPEVKIEDVPINLVSEVPIFPGCEDEASNEAKRECMSQKINHFINKKFNRDLGAELGLSGTNMISVIFLIDENGKIIGAKSRGPHPRLEEEANRVINMLPEMEPGKQSGKTVRVQYSLPIIFKVEN